MKPSPARIAELARQYADVLIRIEEVQQQQNATSAAEVVACVGPRFHRYQEQLYAVLLDTKNHILDVVLITQGTGNTSCVTPREVFRPAIASGAMALILVHNHPSGDPAPSPEDVRLTSVIRKAGEILDVEVLDHVIYGSLTRYVSLREKGFWS